MSVPFALRALTEVTCCANFVIPLEVAVWPDTQVPTETLTWGKVKAQYR